MEIQGPTWCQEHKKTIQKTLNTKEDVLVAQDLNKALWVRGMKNIPEKVRVCVKRGPCTRNPAVNVFRVSLVIVGSFKGLITQSISESIDC